MLMLLFHLGKDLYALDSSHVVEVVPCVPLRTLHQMPEYMAGLLNYRGVIVPVLDLCHWMRGTPSASRLSTRMIMVRHPCLNQTLQYLGLIAEQITDTLNIDPSEIVDSGIRINQAPYLGGMIIREQLIIQCIQIEQIMIETQLTELLGGEEQNAANADTH